MTSEYLNADNFFESPTSDEYQKLTDNLGQLVFATKRYSLVTIETGAGVLQLGENYDPGKLSFFDKLRNIFSSKKVQNEIDYGYQNNGYFLMMDPAYAGQIYAENAFPQLRPRAGESGYTES